MTQSDIEISSCEEEFSDVVISDDEDDLDDLRQSALLSMIKTEKECLVTVSDIEKQLKECRGNLKEANTFSKFNIIEKSSFIDNKKRRCIDENAADAKRFKVSDVVQLVENYVGKPLNVNYDDNFGKQTLSKVPELKNKLFDILSTKRINGKDVTVPTSDNCDVQRHEPTGRHLLRINETKKSIDEIVKSIDAMMVAIHEKLQKSKAISAQIEAMKRHKVELHREVNVTRRKILDLNKVKKQRIVTLAKYRDLRYQYMLSPISSTNIDKIDSLSPISFDTDDSPNTIVDCNQIVCPLWITDSCVNKHCCYQHPKIATKSQITTKKHIQIKENDKVFLREMNPLELVTTFHCDACSSRIFMSNPHIVDDWYCKSCCQQLMLVSKSNDMLVQLINIWHHLYKRYLLAQNVAIEDRDSTVFSSLLKCTDALQAKIINVSNVPTSLLRTVGRHVLIVFNDSGRTDDAVKFLRVTSFDIDLVLFFTTLSFPAVIVNRLIADVIVYQINKASFVKVDVLVEKYCQWCDLCVFDPVSSMFQWLEMVININIVDNYRDVIHALTKSLLTTIIGDSNSHCLHFSFRELQHNENFWIDRRQHIDHLLRLYSAGDMRRSSLYLVVNKFVIISLFFTDNEESAIEMCQRFVDRDFYFQILLSKLSLKYNCPMATDDGVSVSSIEHSYNKSQWLLRNRSEKSCVKMLESVIGKLYGNINEPEPVSCYERFLGVEHDFDPATSTLRPITSDLESKSIRDSSALWLCFIDYLVLTDRREKLTSLIKADSLLDLVPSHLVRVFQLLFYHSSMFDDSHIYCDKIKYALQRIEKIIDFENYVELIRHICFVKLQRCQLSLWLFLVDFSRSHYNAEQCDIFLTEMSSVLLTEEQNSWSYDIFSHVVLCYPIKVEKVWLNLIQLMLNLSLPCHTLIDVCSTAVGSVRYSKSLWQRYYNCAVKLKDEQLIDSVKKNASKIGFCL